MAARGRSARRTRTPAATTSRLLSPLLFWAQASAAGKAPAVESLPRFGEWFNGRFGQEHGHKTMEETLGYVALARQRPRLIPDVVLTAGDGIADPGARLRAQLDARQLVAASEVSKGRGRAR